MRDGAQRLLEGLGVDGSAGDLAAIHLDDGHSLADTHWTTLQPESPNYFFFPRNLSLEGEYEAGWKITEAMPVNGLGLEAARLGHALPFSSACAGRAARAAPIK